MEGGSRQRRTRLGEIVLVAALVPIHGGSDVGRSGDVGGGVGRSMGGGGGDDDVGSSGGGGGKGRCERERERG